MAEGLDPGYRVEIDNVDESAWNAYLRTFDDATLYQTWAYGAMRVEVGKLSHVLLWHGDALASMAQVRITKAPLVPLGIAYVHWGPLWRKGGSAVPVGHLRNMLRALRKEYVMGRRLLLRVLPKVVDAGTEREARAVYDEEGFSWSQDPDQTFFLDLSLPLDELRSRFQRDWRRDLRNAEKQGLRLVEGTDRRTLATAVDLVREMKERKKYFGGGLAELLELQERLPEEFRIRVMYAELDGVPVSALGWQTIGRTGFPVIAATGDKGLKARASFLLWWKMIEYYHDHGVTRLDVGGVNANRNPGGYLFKSRLTGRKDPQPDRYFGQFTAHAGKSSAGLFRAASVVRAAYRHARAMLARFVPRRSRLRKA